MFQFQMSKKERNTGIRNRFDEFFCLHSNLSNNNIISAKRPGLKTGLENFIVCSEIGSGLENRAAHPHQEFRGVPPPPLFGFSFLSGSNSS